MNKIAKLAISILICYSAAFIGSIFTFQSIPTWYASIQKPWFTPPGWLFGPAWLTLYTLMSISLYLVWQKGLKKKNVKKALYVFGVQLGLNTLWLILFFGLKSPFYAFVEIIALWVAIAFMIMKFYKISKKAGLLLVPYIVWVSFAAVLSFYVWRLNLGI